MIRNIFRVIAQAIGFGMLSSKGPSYASQSLASSTGTAPRKTRSRRRKVTSSARKRHDMREIQKAAGTPEKLRAWLSYDNPRGRRTSRPGLPPYQEGAT